MITAQLASIPDREEMLKKTVESLYPQVDRINVSLNGHEHVPKFLKNGCIKIMDNSMGDAAKFYFTENITSGFILSCDDDLIYPDGYVKYMVSKVKLYKSVITLHGRDYGGMFTTYRGGIKYHCLGNVEKDVKVDIGGTGVMAWHTDIVKVKYSDFKIRNMADVWMAKLCKEQGVDIICAAHRSDYLTYQHPEYTIWDEEKDKNFTVQDSILKTFL